MAADHDDFATAWDHQRAMYHALSDESRKDCYCAPLRKPCERHDAWQDGALEVLCALRHVGWMGPYGIVPGGLDVDPAPDWQPLYMVDPAFQSGSTEGVSDGR